MKRVPLVLSLMVITGLILAACGGTPAPQLGKESVELVFWHTQSGSNQKALDEMISTFNATNNKKITIKSEYQGNYTQLYQKVLAAIQAKTPPDLSVGYESQVADYMKANAVIPLDDKIKALDKKIYDDVFPIFWEMAKFPQFKNQTLLAPFTKSVAGIYYNEDALREAGVRVPTIQQPWTWEEFEQAIAKTTKKDASGKTTRYGIAWTVDTSYFDMFVFALGGEVLTKDMTKATLNNPAALKYMELVASTVKAGQAYKQAGFEWQNDFGAGKVVLVPSTSTSRPFMRDAMTDQGKKPEPFKWGFALPPQADPAKPKTVLFGANITIFKTTPLKEAAAWEFIKWWLQPDQTVKWAVVSSYMPVSRSAANHPDLKKAWEKDPQGKMAYDMIPYSIPEPLVAGWQDCRNFIADAGDAVIAGKASPKEALDTATAKCSKVIEESK